MPKKEFYLPETAIRNDNCFNHDFLFYKEATSIALKIQDIVYSYDDLKTDELPVYINNVIGILGRRGTGKTSLMASVSATLINNADKAPFDNSNRIKIIPLMRDIIDPKILPDYIGIVDLVISALFNDFKKFVNNSSEFAEDILDQRINAIYDLFDEIGKDMQLLAAKSREQAVANTSDLYEISGLPHIRNKIEKLVKKLLGLYNNDNIDHLAYMLLIDDFDLDFDKCYEMTLSIISTLNIKGLIFLISMDPDVYKRGIIRKLIKDHSDYGQITQQLLTDRFSIRLAASSGQNTSRFAREFTSSIILNEEQYFDQLYNKFIPMDYRFYIKAHDISETGTKQFKDRFTAFCKWIFGIEPSWSVRKSTDRLPFVERFYALFFGIFKSGDDLRLRNQGINRLLMIMEQNESPNYTEAEVLNNLISVFDSFSINASEESRNLYKEISFSLSQRLYSEEERSNLYLFHSNASALEMDDDTYVLVYSLCQPFFDEHPASYAAYETMVAILTSKTVNIHTLVDDYYNILSCFTEKVSISIGEAGEVSDGASYSLVFDDGRRINADRLAQTLFHNSREMIIKQINDIIGLSVSSVHKYDINVLLASIADYMNKKYIPSESIAPFIDEITEALAEKWRGKDNTKVESIERIRNALGRIKRRL